MAKDTKNRLWRGGLKNTQGGVEFASRDIAQISKEQQQILDMLTKDYLTAKQIATRRKTSLAAVYKSIEKLRKKDYISSSILRGLKMNGCTHTHSTPPIHQKVRLHNQEFNIKILTASDKYHKIKAIKTKTSLDGNTIRLFSSSIEVYSNPLRHFYGRNPKEALAASETYWARLFLQLEDFLGISFLKDKNTSIREVNAHYSEINNGLAHANNKKGQKMRFKGSDGKTWLITDNSFNLNELEAVHAEYAHEDMEKIKPFFDDLRQNPVKLSQIMTALYSLAKSEGKIAEGTIAILTSLNPSAYYPQEDGKNKKIPDYIN